MKLTLARADLARATAAIARLVERRATIPILTNLLLTAKDGALALTGTDLDMAATVTIPAEIEVPGALTVPAGILADWTKKLPDNATVTLNATDRPGGSTSVVATAGRTRATLQTLPAIDFPDLAVGPEPTQTFTVSGKALAALLDAVAFAISTEETRYYLNGIFLHAAETDRGPALRAVATDRHRLGRADMPLPEGAAGLPGVIVPRKAVAELVRLAEAEADLTIAISPAKIVVTAGATRFVSKLIDGTFPDYARVIPSGNDRVATLERTDLTRAVERVATVSAERGRAVKLEFDDGRVTLAVNSPDHGNAVEEVDVLYDAAAITIGFNARYVLDLLTALASDTVALAMSDAGAPSTWTAPGDPTRLYVLMPMRV